MAMMRPRRPGLRGPRKRKNMATLGKPQIGTSSPHPPGGPSDAMLDQGSLPSLHDQLNGLMGGMGGGLGGGGGGGGQGY